MGAAVVLRNQAREVFPRCCTQMLLRIILLVVLIRGEALDWRSIANGAKNFGKSLKDKATSLFEGEDAVVSDEENHCEAESCASLSTDHSASNNQLSKSKSLTDYLKSVSFGAGKLLNDAAKKAYDSVSDAFESMKSAVKSAFREEFSDLLQPFLPNLSSPGKLLLKSIWLLPEVVRDLVLLFVAAVLTVLIWKFIGVWFSLAYVAVVYVYFRAMGSYGVLETGVRLVEACLMVVHLALQYPLLSGMIIVSLLVIACCWPVYTWWYSRRLQQRQAEMYRMIVNINSVVMDVQQKQNELKELVQKLKNVNS